MNRAIPGPVRATMVRLGAEEQRYSLGEEATIGRLPTADIQVDEKAVSREHARLTRMGRGYVIEDLRSTNGTRVNGERITEPVLLQSGDVIRVGRIEFRYETVRPQREPEEAREGTPSFLRRRPRTQTESTQDQPVVAEPRSDVAAIMPEPVVEVPQEQQDDNEPESSPAPGPLIETTAPSEAAFTQPAASEPLQPAAAEPIQTDGVDLAHQALLAARGLIPLLEALGSQPSRRTDLGAELRSLMSRQEVRILPESQVAAVQRLLDALLTRPRDVDLLTQLSQQVPTLISITQEYARACDLLRDLEARIEQEQG